MQAIDQLEELPSREPMRRNEYNYDSPFHRSHGKHGRKPRKQK